MAAVVNNSARAFSTGNLTNLSTGSFAIGGANRVLYVLVASGAGSPIIPTAVKWGGSGGTSLTQIGTTINPGASGFGCMSLWRLIAPAATTSTVFVDWGTNQDETLIVAVAVEDADQTTPNNTVAQANSTGTAVTANATSVSGDLVLDFMFFLDADGHAFTISPAGGQSSIIEIEGADTGFEGMGSSSKSAAGASTTMAWTISGSTFPTDWGTYALAVNGAAGGGGGFVPSQFYYDQLIGG